jgi:hypothetical protein
MINSSKHSKESIFLSSNPVKNFEGLGIIEEIEDFDLLKMTSDIEKIFCEEENFCNFEKIEEAAEITAVKVYNQVDAQSNNNSFLANGNIWQNNNENCDDSLILAEKFENLKRSRNERKNKNMKKEMYENCFSFGNHLMIEEDLKRNFCNLKQSKYFEKVNFVLIYKNFNFSISQFLFYTRFL